MKKLFLLLLIGCALGATDRYPFTDPLKQERFDHLTRNTRCMVCQNQSIAESQAPLAEDLRQHIYQMIQDNKNDDMIQKDLVKHYGEFILYDPPMNAGNALLWLTPLILLAVFIIPIFIKRVKRHAS